MLNFNEIVKQYDADRSSPLNRIDKNGRFYHVVQRASNRENIYDNEIAKYRANLLARICTMYNVTILFSVVMSNHTHDILMAEKWELIAQVIKEVNSAVARRLRKKSQQKYTNGRRVFEESPYYRAIHDIVALMVVAKYVFDNAKSIEDKGKYVPYSCFWFMRNDRLNKPYRKELYPLFFGMTEIELCNFFDAHTLAEVRTIATQLFKDWTQTDNDSFFKADISLSWLE